MAQNGLWVRRTPQRRGPYSLPEPSMANSFSLVEATCRECDGEGFVGQEECPDCSGSGVIVTRARGI